MMKFDLNHARAQTDIHPQAARARSTREGSAEPALSADGPHTRCACSVRRRIQREPAADLTHRTLRTGHAEPVCSVEARADVRGHVRTRVTACRRAMRTHGRTLVGAPGSYRTSAAGSRSSHTAGGRPAVTLSHPLGPSRYKTAFFFSEAFQFSTAFSRCTMHSLAQSLKLCFQGLSAQVSGTGQKAHGC